MFNDQVIPFFEEYELRLLRVLADRGTEYCWIREQHEYQLYLVIEDIDHPKTKAKSLKPTVYVSVFTEPFRKNF